MTTKKHQRQKTLIKLFPLLLIQIFFSTISLAATLTPEPEPQLEPTPPRILQPNLIDNVNNRGAVFFSYMRVDYDEPNPGGFTPLDSVNGHTPGGEISVNKTFYNVYLSAILRAYKHDLRYRGGIIGGGDDDDSISEKTDNFFAYIMGQAGYVFHINNELAFTPYFEYGWRRWDREVPPIGIFQGLQINGYTEVYEHYFYDFAARLQYELADKFVFGVYAGIGHVRKPTMFTNSFSRIFINGIPYNVVAGFKYKMTSKTLRKYGITMDYFATNIVQLHLGWHYEEFKYGASPRDPLGFLEPNSKTRNHTLEAGVAFTIMAGRTEQPEELPPVSYK